MPSALPGGGETLVKWFKSYGKGPTDPPGGGEENSLKALTNFTPRAQQALALARSEAERFNHNFVGTEHLLLGLIRLGQGTAVAVLRRMGLNL